MRYKKLCSAQAKNDLQRIARRRLFVYPVQQRERSTCMDGLWGFIGAMIIGGIAGWLAGKIMRGGGFGILGNIIIGVIGGLLGGWLFSLLGITILGGSGWIGQIIVGLVGAVIILFIAGLFKRG
ncbi:MAG TPA: GlsB/YeaQ/YmgE family stress response membrane protein [Caldilinea sp.]|nr:GlsB/YeaQ/YmgE family stress response membrane protein [Caldilinea sp.]